MDRFEERREQIKNAGRKLFAAYGYNKTTLEDIAGMLKLKKNSLYYYFENKDALFKELIEEEVALHLEKQKNMLQEELPVSEKLFNELDGIIKFIRERTFKYSIRLSSYLEIGKIIRKEFPYFQQKQCAILTSLLKEGVKNKEFRAHNSKQLASDIEWLITAVFNDYYFSSDAEFVHEIDFDLLAQKLKRLLSYILNGIKAG